VKPKFIKILALAKHVGAHTSSGELLHAAISRLAALTPDRCSWMYHD
jgi:hypothetical protein